MLKFFRKIRYDLMENQTSAKASAGRKTDAPAEAGAKAGKYLKYAIGEILLVVIGILIALQINNWNENQQLNKVETSTLKALLGEFEANRNSIKSYQGTIIKSKLFGDSLRMQIGTEMTRLTKDEVNRLIGEISTTDKCKVSIDILGDIQSSGKLNLISNEEIRRSISKWSSVRKELEGEENDWAQEFSNQFIPYSNKWILWDDIDFQFNRNEPGYFRSSFNIDPRLILQKPEFSNIVAIQYWRIARVKRRTDSLLVNTDKLLTLLKQELKK